MAAVSCLERVTDMAENKEGRERGREEEKEGVEGQARKPLPVSSSLSSSHIPQERKTRSP